jgi:hypothetical protein
LLIHGHPDAAFKIAAVVVNRLPARLLSLAREHFDRGTLLLRGESHKRMRCVDNLQQRRRAFVNTTQIGRRSGQFVVASDASTAGVSLVILDPETGVPLEHLEGKLDFYQGPQDRGGFKGFLRMSLTVSVVQKTVILFWNFCSRRRPTL